MRALSERMARECENAVNPRCECRCGGAAHGKARIGPDAPREDYEQLPEDDPHRIQREKPTPCKESSTWRPAHWKPGKLARYMLHVYKQASWACCQILGEHDGNILAAQLRADLAERKSVALLREKVIPLIGDSQ